MLVWPPIMSARSTAKHWRGSAAWMAAWRAKKRRAGSAAWSRNWS